MLKTCNAQEYCFSFINKKIIKTFMPHSCSKSTHVNGENSELPASFTVRETLKLIHFRLCGESCWLCSVCWERDQCLCQTLYQYSFPQCKWIPHQSLNIDGLQRPIQRQPICRKQSNTRLNLTSAGKQSKPFCLWSKWTWLNGMSGISTSG